MCNFQWKESTKEEVENAMLVPGEYKIEDGKYYIPTIPGFLDGYICSCFDQQEKFDDPIILCDSKVVYS
jgi:hypothetical protein